MEIFRYLHAEISGEGALPSLTLYSPTTRTLARLAVLMCKDLANCTFHVWGAGWT